MWKWALAFAVVLLASQGVVADEEEEGRDCVCVPYYLCNDGSIIDDGSTAITIRMRECDNFLDVCCEVPPSHILPAPEVPSATLPAPVPGNVVCGHRNIGGVSNALDVRGDEAHFGEFPWMVAVLEVKETDSSTRGILQYRCGGSLIHPKVVLTAAHCVAGKENLNLKIRAGEWDTQSTEEPYGKQDRDVERFVVHEQFGKANLSNDVALLFLSEPAEAAEHIGFACLPPQGYLPANGTRCFATGWGKDKSGRGGVYRTILNKVDLPVMANPECQAALRQSSVGSYFRLHPSFMCAGGEEGRDTCEGDGGGPLVCPLPDNPGIYIQSGIVAWGIRCGLDKLPGVYASVAFFRNWIDDQMQAAQLNTSTYSF